MDLNLDFARPQAIDRCAWYLRVSTPKQKLEHQREHVLRFDWVEVARRTREIYSEVQSSRPASTTKGVLT